MYARAIHATCSVGQTGPRTVATGIKYALRLPTTVALQSQHANTELVQQVGAVHSSEEGVAIQASIATRAMGGVEPHTLTTPHNSATFMIMLLSVALLLAGLLTRSWAKDIVWMRQVSA